MSNTYFVFIYRVYLSDIRVYLSEKCVSISAGCHPKLMPYIAYLRY